MSVAPPCIPAPNRPGTPRDQFSKPDWDLLIVVDEADALAHDWFPAKTRDCKNLIVLKGLKFRHSYLTSRKPK
ncbi:hypothetical protein ACX80V_03355 [Arthrobacter sp. MDT3-24]